MTIHFEPEAANHIAEMTSAMVGERLEVVVNGTVISAPVVAEPIQGDEMQLFASSDGTFADISAYSQIPC